MLKKVCLAVAVLMLLTPSAWAFNAKGHRVIAEIAWQKLDANQRKAIVEILKKNPRFKKDFTDEMPPDIASANQATKDHWIFCQAAIWPDIVRDIGGTDQDKFHRPLWHFINLPVFVSDDQEDAFNGSAPPSVNVEFSPAAASSELKLNGVQAVKHSLRIVTDRAASAQDKAVHYCWVMHVIPDLSQPLHGAALFTVNIFPEGDRGGNSVKIDNGSRNGTSLHSVWDGLLGKEDDFDEVVKTAKDIIKDHPTDFSAALSGQLPDDVWTNESREHARKTAYGPLLKSLRKSDEKDQTPRPFKLNDTYLKAANTVIRKQAVTAGVRLAGVLAKTVAPPPTSIVSAPNPPPASLRVPIAPSTASSESTEPVVESVAIRRILQTAEGPFVPRESDSLALRVTQLESEVFRLRALVEQLSARSQEPQVAPVRSELTFPRSTGDGEQCDCGRSEKRQGN